ELQELNVASFEYAIDSCLSERVSFVIVAGDFFDISFPTNTSVLARVFSKLRELKEASIPLYLIPGSHDFSASGSSMLRVCGAAGLCVNLMNLLESSNDGNNGKTTLKLFKDSARNLVLTGVLGLRIGMEVDVLKNIDKAEVERAVNNEKGLKIFLVHTAVTELLPSALANEHIEQISLSDLPAGFHYYAAGHIHDPIIFDGTGRGAGSGEQGAGGGEFGARGAAAYSGCIFPNNFTELASIQHGSFILADFDPASEKLSLKKQDIKLRDVISLEFDAEGKSAKEVESEILACLDGKKLGAKILLLKVSGTLSSGKPSDINFELVQKIAQKEECFSFLRNTHGLATKEFEVAVSKASSVEEIELDVVNGAFKNLDDKEKEARSDLVFSLMHLLNKEKAEDETRESFSARIVDETIKILNLEEKI
ncbi:MAG TPA: hypothetical protein HA223_06140, partial [Nanoarchaeota archaeon]|nr:hypothetical protein [Nanoarchaeota archaeon]